MARYRRRCSNDTERASARTRVGFRFKSRQGKYLIRFEFPRIGEHSARRRRKEFVFGEEAAEKCLRERLAEVGRGDYPEEDRLTFSTVLDRFLADKEMSLEPTTVEKYRRMFAQHIRPRLGAKLVRDVRAHDIRTLPTQARWASRTRRDRKSLGPRTRLNLLTMLRMVLAWAIA